jgi:putative spermidine/putrescine transport system permease protein
VWIYTIGGSQAQLSVAVSVLSLVLTWLLLVLLTRTAGRSPASRTSSRKG